MYYCWIAWAVMVLAAGDAFAETDDAAAAKNFIPLAAAHHVVPGVSSPPHFFPLKSRQMGKFPLRLTHVTQQAEAIPTLQASSLPHDASAATPMTPEQARQILSLFGNGE